jgi:hypothetical protein
MQDDPDGLRRVREHREAYDEERIHPLGMTTTSFCRLPCFTLSAMSFRQLHTDRVIRWRHFCRSFKVGNRSIDITPSVELKLTELIINCRIVRLRLLRQLF